MATRNAEAVTNPRANVAIPAFASANSATPPAESAVSATGETAIDPIEQARQQLQAQRKQDEESVRVAEMARLDQARLAEQQRMAEARETAQRANDQGNDQFAMSPASSRMPANFAGSWQCRIYPSQRGAYTSTIQSQIAIHPTTRGFEAFVGGQRLSSIDIQGNHIRFAQMVAGNGTEYYGAIDFDLQNSGSTLLGIGRVRIGNGPYTQEVPASLTCTRGR